MSTTVTLHFHQQLACIVSSSSRCTHCVPILLMARMGHFCIFLMLLTHLFFINKRIINQLLKTLVKKNKHKIIYQQFTSSYFDGYLV